VPDRGRAVVVGGGVAGLVWALDAAEAGYRVTVLEHDVRFGGAVRSERLGPVIVDVGAESFALTRPDLLDLTERLGLSAEVERPTTHQAHVLAADRLLPLPPGVLGVPADPTDVSRLLGTEVAEEAVRRDTLPVAASAPASLGRLVRERLGDAVADVLVDPVVAGVHATRADDAELASVAPGLHAAALAHGGLMAGVRALRGALGPAGSPVATLHGGMDRLVGRLVEELSARGVALRAGTEVTALDHDGTWRVRTREGRSEGHLDADVVCLAVPTRRAAALLRTVSARESSEAAAGLGARLAELPTTDDVLLVTLLIEDRALTRAGAPVGSGVLVAGGDRVEHDGRDQPGPRAKALTHASAKWGWLAARLPDDHHVVRLSFGGTHVLDPAATGDAQMVAAATRELPRILGPSSVEGDVTVRAALVTRWQGALARPVIGRASRLAEIDAEVAALPRIALVGSGVAGNGLAGVVGRSRLEAVRTL